MTDPQTPATEAGRRLLRDRYGSLADKPEYTRTMTADILAIEAEARADADLLTEDEHIALRIQAVHDALREAADAVRANIADIAAAMPWYDDANPDYAEAIAAVLAILDPQP